MFWFGALLLPFLAGCASTDVAADLGYAPPVRLATAAQRLVVHLRNDPRLVEGERERLGHGIALLAAGNPTAIRAEVKAKDEEDADTVRRALIGAGIDPQRISSEVSPSALRLQPRVRLTRSFVETADSSNAMAPAWAGNPLLSLSSIGACIRANNLAAMLADPADLRAPLALGPADGASVVGSLVAWPAQRSAPVQAGTTTSDSTTPAESSPAPSTRIAAQATPTAGNTTPVQ